MKIDRGVAESLAGHMRAQEKWYAAKAASSARKAAILETVFLGFMAAASAEAYAATAAAYRAQAERYEAIARKRASARARKVAT